MRPVVTPNRQLRLSPEQAPTIDRACAPIKALVSAAFAVPVAEMDIGRSRHADVTLARQSAMYLAHVALGLQFSMVGLAFHRDRTTAAHACDAVGRRRENPHIDAILVRLELACRRAASADAGRLA